MTAPDRESEPPAMERLAVGPVPKIDVDAEAVYIGDPPVHRPVVVGANPLVVTHDCVASTRAHRDLLRSLDFALCVPPIFAT